MPKRTATGGIKAAFALQADRAAASKHTADWVPLESRAPSTQPVREDYLVEADQKAEDYLVHCKGVFEALNKADKPGLKTPRAPTRHGSTAAAADDDDVDSSSLVDRERTRVTAWQARGAQCVQLQALWPGSGIPLSRQQQEQLLYIVGHHDMHLDPHIATTAYQLLLHNLQDHPPAKFIMLLPQASSSGSSSTGRQPPGLHVDSLCWDLGLEKGNSWQEMVAENKAQKGTEQTEQEKALRGFPLLQQLVRNAVLLVTGKYGGSGSSGGGNGSSGGSGGGGGGGGGGSSTSRPNGSQGQALLLLYVVELLQADLLPRQAAFEHHRQLMAVLDTEMARDEAARRAATVLQNSWLFRIMQDDFVGGNAWGFVEEGAKGKHQLVRDLLLLASCSGGQAASPAPTRHSLVQAMLDAHTAAAPAPAADAAAAAADAAHHAAAVDAAAAAPVTSLDLVAAGRRLLVLLLQLFSSCEEAGVYSSGAGSRHHMQRSTAYAPAVANDRLEMDRVFMQAIGAAGQVSAHRLPQLKQQEALVRLLQVLPAVHRVRLLSLMVAEAIKTRAVDPESEGRLASTDYNLEVTRLREYLEDRGKGQTGFRQPLVLEVIRAVDVRLDWALKEMFGGGQQFALLMGLLINTAPSLLHATDQQAFAEVAGRIMEHTLKQQCWAQGNIVGGLLDGLLSAPLLAVVAAMQQLQLAVPVSTDAS